MSDYPLIKYSAKIKDVYIEVKDYQFFHSPYKANISTNRFIGRKKVKDRIISILQNTNVKSGAYLITGFRGMGKTSLIREALNDYNGSRKTDEFNTLNLVIDEFMKLLRVLICYVFGFLLIQFFFIELLKGRIASFLILSLSLFLFIFITEKRKNILELVEPEKKDAKENEENKEEDDSKHSEEPLKKPKASRFLLTTVANALKLAEKLTPVSQFQRFLLVVAVYTILFVLLQLLLVDRLQLLLVDRFHFSNYVSLSLEFILPLIFYIHAPLTLRLDKVFESTWSTFKIIFITSMFIIAGMFFLNYKYVCDKSYCPGGISTSMSTFFPPVTTGTVPAAAPSEKPAANSTVTPAANSAVTPAANSAVTPAANSAVTPAANSAEIPAVNSAGTQAANSAETPAANSAVTPAANSVVTPAANSAGTPAVNSAETPAATPKVTPAAAPVVPLDSFTFVYRIIIAIFFSYIIFSLILFSIDFIYLVRISWMYEKKNTGGQKEQYRYFEINLSQDSLDEMDILRRMAIALEQYWLKRKFEFDSSIFNRKFFFFWRFIISKVNRPRKESYEPSYKSVSSKLSLLKNRISGQMTTRRERKAPPNLTSGPIGGLAELSMPLGTFTDNDEISLPVANAKEAEDQLREILDDIDELRKKLDIPEFAFIIDELDKIDPHNNSIIQEKEFSNPMMDSSLYAEDTNRFRQRREAVGRLLANLKGFLNVVRAKFFFIGGREMFDADLADIADRESFYSSIFNDVIYVESFFKDSVEVVGQGRGGITQMTERYICNIILNDQNPSQSENEKDLSLKRLHDQIVGTDEGYLKFKPEREIPDKSENEITSGKKASEDEITKQKYKVISTLQNYIVYLTYRSSGTPKKLTGLTEQLIVKGPGKKNKDDTNEDFFRDNLVLLHDSKKDLNDRLFLKFGFNTQYEIGLTSNIYRPYLIANSRHLKSLGDKLLFSSSFIIDHILKFHPFGFSWRNLEMIPEVVLVNREPNLREFIEDLMRFYSLNYIRDTVSGIFDYRFRSIIRRELIHLSKTSDLSAAAFNFTLDESLSTKRHYKRKFIELSGKYKDYQPVEGDNQFVHALYFVQTILGDLHFYDKEYDEAVLYYTESIQTLRLPNAVTDRKITRHQFLLWVKNKLKLGLTLEKMRAFDSAFSIYKTLTLDTERYFERIVSKELSNPVGKDRSIRKSKIDRFEEAEDHRSMHLVSMPFVALLAVTEKARNDGITYTNLFTNRRDFLRTINPPEDNAGQNDIVDIKNDKYRKYHLMADYYNNVGSILFYKNCQFSEFFNNYDYWLDAFKETREIDRRGWNSSENKNPIISQQMDIYDADDKPYDFFPSLTSFNYYWNSLYYLVKYHRERIVLKVIKRLPNLKPSGNLDEVEIKDNLLALCTAYLLPECIDMVGSSRIYYIANVISKIGDSILASLNKKNFNIPESEFNALDITGWAKDTEKGREQNIEKFHELVNKKLFSAETVLYIYKLAAALYKRAGHNSYYASHLTKILYVIKDLIELNKNKETKQYEQLNKKLIKFLVKEKEITGFDVEDKKTLIGNIEKIAETVFRATTWNNEVSNRPQILKYREIFNISIRRNKDRELIYNSINNISDAKEVIVLVEGIKMKLGKDVGNFVDNFTIGKSIISAYGTMSSRYQRMLELKYRTERCYFIMNQVLRLSGLFTRGLRYSVHGDEKVIVEQIYKIIKEGTESEPEIKINDVVIFLIQEALFCSSQLIKMIKLYNPGYVIGYSFIAEAHSRMGDWCQAYDNYIKIMDEDTAEYEHIYENHLRFLEDRKAQIEQIDLVLSPGWVKRLYQEYNSITDHIKNWKENKNILSVFKSSKENRKTLNEDTTGYENHLKFLQNEKARIEKIDLVLSPGWIKYLYQEYNSITDHIEKWRKNKNKILNVFNPSEENRTDLATNKVFLMLIEVFEIKEDAYSYKIFKHWTERLEKIHRFRKDEFITLKKETDIRIEEFLGGESLIYVESKNHYETAVQYYYKMIQMHSDGKTYKDKLHEIYMLEDDYNDNLAHYTIASERIRINCGKVKEKINRLNERIEDSKVYVYSSYLTSIGDDSQQLDIEKINKYVDFFAKDIKPIKV